mgnify:CR=1 FL=1
MVNPTEGLSRNIELMAQIQLSRQSKFISSLKGRGYCEGRLWRTGILLSCVYLGAQKESS